MELFVLHWRISFVMPVMFHTLLFGLPWELHGRLLGCMYCFMLVNNWEYVYKGCQVLIKSTNGNLKVLNFMVMFPCRQIHVEMLRFNCKWCEQLIRIRKNKFYTCSLISYETCQEFKILHEMLFLKWIEIMNLRPKIMISIIH